MNQPFIRNHQLNLIKKQADLLLHACNTVSDRKVVDSVRYSAQNKISAAFPDAPENHQQTLAKISSLNTASDVQQYLHTLEPYLLAEFAQVTDKQLHKLFPKVKKLKVPDLSAIDGRFVTYLGWTDISTNRMFLVYRLDGQLVGIEGKFTPVNKKSYCFACNRQQSVALFTANSKTRPANATPDYYKTVGNYLCVDSSICNKNITDVAALEKFIREVTGNCPVS